MTSASARAAFYDCPLVISAGCGVFLRQHFGYLPAAGWATVIRKLLAAGVAVLVTRWIDEPSVRWSKGFGDWFMRTFTADSPEKKVTAPS